MIQHRNLQVIASRGISVEELKKKEHNIWLGISLSNSFFIKENIRSLIEFSLEYTKSKILIWIPGEMHALNYGYFNHLSDYESLRLANEDEERIMREVQGIISCLPPHESKKIVTANYRDICTEKYLRQRAILFDEFKMRKSFYLAVMDIVKDYINNRGRTYYQNKAEVLAQYILKELPLFVDGVQKSTDKTLYTVIPYPGFSNITELEIDIIKGIKYPELTKKLNLTNEIGILDVDIK